MNRIQSSRLTRLINIPHYANSGRDIKVLVTNDSNRVDEWLHRNVYAFKKEKKLVVGLDIEWEPSFGKSFKYNKTDLIQIATPHEALLYQCRHIHTPKLNQSTKSLPASLLKLIEAKDIIKAGVGVYEDLQRISKDFKCDITETDYRDVCSAAYRRNDLDKLPGRSLYALASHLCGSTVVKQKKIQLSNWGAEVLSTKQIQYASYDALMGLDIYRLLDSEGYFDEESLQQFILKCGQSWEREWEKECNTVPQGSVQTSVPVPLQEPDTLNNSPIKSNGKLAVQHLAGRTMMRFFWTRMNECPSYLHEIAQILRRNDQAYLSYIQLGQEAAILFEENKWQKGLCRIEQANMYRVLLPRLLSRYMCSAVIRVDRSPHDKQPSDASALRHVNKHEGVSVKNQVISEEVMANGRQWETLQTPAQTDHGATSHHVGVSVSVNNVVLARATANNKALAAELACRDLFMRLLELESKVAALPWFTAAAGKGDYAKPIADFLHLKVQATTQSLSHASKQNELPPTVVSPWMKSSMMPNSGKKRKHDVQTSELEIIV